MSKAKVSQNQENQNQNQSSNHNVLRKSNNNRIKSSSSSLAPRGEPWNHDQFLKRVSTFNSLKWHIKRKDVNPLLCARYGWECVQINTLKCSGCGTSIKYKTNSLWTVDINNKMAQSFLQNIRSAHTPQCIWKNNPCDASFESLPMDTNIMKQQLIENVKTWTQTDCNSFYIIPKIDPSAKNLMIEAIPQSTNDHNKWINHPSCCDIMLLSGSGWYLSPLFNTPSINTTPYAQCRYCNKCVSLQSYDYKRIISLLPDTFHTNNSFLNAINEDSEEEHLEEKEMELDETKQDEQAQQNDEVDISSILNRELPINDTDSIMHRLSKLGLKINSNIRRTHGFQIYETKSLQKQAHFINDDEENLSSLSDGAQSDRSSLSGIFRSSSPLNLNRPFGSSTFANYNAMQMTCSQCMKWPKQSILTQPNSRLMSISKSHSNSVPESQQKRRKNRKRARDQMSMEPELQHSAVLELEHQQQPRKKLKVSKIHNIDESYNENAENSNNKKARKSRKRKTMESDFGDEWIVDNKRRRVDTETTNTASSSVSTTVSLPSSNETTSVYSTPVLDKKIQRRSRKRKFNDIFEDDDDNVNVEDDEDDDIKSELDDKIGDISSIRPIKRARLDTPTVPTQAYFDPINSHNEHCPFILEHQYQQNLIKGYVYCLKLLPKDIMYIKQIIDDQSKKTNQAKSRF